MSESGEPASQALPSSDAELIKAVASGNAAAYATLHERHIAAARILARRVAPSAVEAEEVLSETFARLHGVLRRGEGPAEALRPFLLTAVRRVAQERSSAGVPGPMTTSRASASRCSSTRKPPIWRTRGLRSRSVRFRNATAPCCGTRRSSRQIRRRQRLYSG